MYKIEKVCCRRQTFCEKVYCRKGQEWKELKIKKIPWFEEERKSQTFEIDWVYVVAAKECYRLKKIVKLKIAVQCIYEKEF